MISDAVSTLSRRSLAPLATLVLLLVRGLEFLAVLGFSLFLCAEKTQAQTTQSVSLAWDPDSTDPGIAGYCVYYGTASRAYTNTNQVGNVTTATISGLQPGTTYYFAVTDYNSTGLVSPPSNEVSYQVPAAGGGLVSPVITWTAPANVVYGATLSSAQLNATANVPGTFTYAPALGAVLPAGSGQSLTAVFTPADPTSYRGATNSVSITVLPAPLSITAVSQSKVYGAVLPALTASYAGFVNGDTPVKLTVAPALSTTATSSSQAGSYPITVNSAVSPNYAISYVSGTLTVSKAGLTITASSKTKVYGASVPPLTANYAGFVNGDAVSSLSTAPSLSTTAAASSPVGSYPITANGATAANYTITYINGALSVTPGSLTVTADSKTKVYGSGLPVLTASYAGFVNGDTVSSLTTAPSLSTTATTSSPVGSYPITANGAVGANYTIGSVNGSLSVTPASLTITADSKSMVKGSAVPALTASYTGFVNADSPASFSTPVQLTTTATSSSLVGSYPITASGAADADYVLTYVNGVLTVTAPSLVSLAVTAATNSVMVGQNQQLTALGTYSDGTKQDLTASASWASAAPFVATINNSGIATGIAAGSTVITATQSRVSGSFLLSVSALTTNATAFANLNAINIPANGMASPYPSAINVSGLSGTITRVTVTLSNFTHTAPHDVNVLLVSPSGGETLLMANNGGNHQVSNLTLTFDDNAGSCLPSSSQLTSGTFRPSCYGACPTFPSPAPVGPYLTNLSTFSGFSANGTWSLYVADDTAQHSGKIANGWRLTITTVSGAQTMQTQQTLAAENGDAAAPKPGEGSAVDPGNLLTIRSLAVLPGNEVHLLLSGQTGESYRLLSSTDLITWRVVYTDTVSSEQFMLVDRPGAAADHRFYRIEATTLPFQR